MLSLEDAIGSSSPTFTGHEKIRGYETKEGKGFSLLCEAHGFPIPMFR